MALKTPRADLESSVANELLAYLGNGEINAVQLAETHTPQFESLDTVTELKTLHFVLSERVQNFVSVLPERLRRISTTTRSQTVQTQGEVRGQIDWKQTLESRAARGYDDPTLFTINTPAVESNTPENRVLKCVLSVLADGIKLLKEVDQPWWKGWDDPSPEWVIRQLEENVYLSRLPSVSEITLSARDLNAARCSRHEFYVDCYELHRLFDDFVNDRYENTDVQKLFVETLVTPASDAKLFELYCVIQYLRRFDTVQGYKIQRIQPGMGAFATFEATNGRVEVYYDRTGPLSFSEQFPDSDSLRQRGTPEPLQRMVLAYEEYQGVVSEFLDKSSNSGLYSGRPDLLAIVYGPNDCIEKITIGEVKYTRSKQTFARGLRELCEYLYFLQHNAEFLYGSNEVNVPEIRGIIFSDGVSTEVGEFDSIKHLTTSMLAD
ncbi:hypothetical protein [Haloferax sp. DFSO60]|uniref:hypothetical protein n=1 Tax=Haloferax sp. DFSO60 TaxID=3388652 RepID=UPI00397A3166